MATVRAWNIEHKISAVVTDNAANIVGAVKKNNWRHVPCFAHVLNIGIQRGLTHLKTVLTKIKNVVEFFKQSSGLCINYRTIKNKWDYQILS